MLTMETPKPPEITDDKWFSKLATVREEILVPGFWNTLSDGCRRWAEEVSVGPFWAKAKDKLDQWRTEYRTLNNGDLLTASGLKNFVSKPEASIRDKVIRKCKKNCDSLHEVINVSGPPVPSICDLVRTRVACPYIDGVEFFANKLTDLANEMQLSPERERKGMIEGYFAQHITVQQQVIYRFGGGTQLANIRCEIQVASELATRMWDASHDLYENVRRDPTEAADWQWKPDDPRFISNQLGHMIHLADGLLVQLRKTTK